MIAITHLDRTLDHWPLAGSIWSQVADLAWENVPKWLRAFPDPAVISLRPVPSTKKITQKPCAFTILYRKIAT